MLRYGDNGIIRGSRIIEELMKGKLNAEEMAELSKGRLRRRKEELKEALVRKMQENHKFMIKASLGHIKAIEEELSALEYRIQEKIERHFKVVRTIWQNSNSECGTCSGGRSPPLTLSVVLRDK